MDTMRIQPSDTAEVPPKDTSRDQASRPRTPRSRLFVRAGVVLAVLFLSFWQAQPYVPTQVRSFFGGGDISYLYWLFAWQLDRLAALDFSGLANAPVFFPAPYGAAYSGQVLSTSLAALPLYLAGVDPYRLYNLFVFWTYPLCFLGAYLFARLGGFRPASCLTAAALFAFNSYRLNTGGYLSHMAMQWIPFVLYFLTLFLRTGKARHAWLCCLFFLLHAGASEHNFVLGTLYFALYAALYAARARLTPEAERPDGRKVATFLGKAAGPLVVALAGSAALYWPSLMVARDNGVRRSLADTLLYAADLEHFLGATLTWLFTPLFKAFAKAGNILWPTLAGLTLFALGVWRLSGARERGKTRRGPCALATVGLVAILAGGFALKSWPDPDLFQAWYFVSAPATGPLHAALCLAAGVGLAWLMVRGFVWAARLPEAVFFPGAAAYLAFVGFLASLGPLVKVHGLLLAVNPAAYLVYVLVPGGDAVRAVTRSFHFFSLFFGVVCAFAFDRLLASRSRAGRALAWGLALILLLDLVPAWAPDFTLRRQVPETPGEYVWLRSRPTPGPVLEIPLGEDSNFMERALVHRNPLVNGFGSFFWRGYAVLRQALEKRGPAGSLDDIQALGTRYLLMHDAGPTPPERLGPFALRARFGSTACYENPDAAPSPAPPDLPRRMRAHLYGLDGDRLAVVLHFTGLERPFVTTRRLPLELTLVHEDGSSRRFTLWLPPGLWGPTSQWDSASDAHLALRRPNGRFPLRVELDGQTLYERREGDPPPRVASFDTIMTDLARINLALTAFFRTYGVYPRGDSTDVTDDRGRHNPEWIRGLVPEFLPELPRDPRGLADPYRGYLYFSDGMSFKLIVHAAPDGYKIRSRYPQVADPIRGDAYGVFQPQAARW